MSVKLYSYTGLRQRYGDLTNENTTNHLDRGMNIMNDIYTQICNREAWDFLEELDTSQSTVADQAEYDLPQDAEKVKSVSIDVSTTRYPLQEVNSWQDWEALNQAVTWSSAFPTYYFVTENNKVNIWPTPSDAGNTIRIVYTKRPTRLSVADYTTGTITTATNGSKTITGSGTTWTDQMAGSDIMITKTFDDNSGDGRVYKIASVASATSLTLTRNYEGNSISGGSASYTIGEVPLVPQKYCPLLVYYAAYQYWSVQDNGQSRAVRFSEMYQDMFNQLIIDENQRASSVIVEPVARTNVINPNLYT